MADPKYIGKNVLNHTLELKKGNVSGSATSTGSFGKVEVDKVGVSDGFYHSSDADEETYIKFPTGDKIDIVAGGVNFIYAWQKDADVNKLIFNEDNTDTDIVFRSANGSNNKLLYLDASADKIGIKTGTPDEALTVEGNISASGALMGVTHVTASGNLTVGQYIYHKDDANTYLNFTDDRLRFNIGGISYIDLNDSSTAPHDITFNDGGNNIDLTIKGTSNNPLFKTDASANRIGTHGLGSPAVDFHIGGSELRVDGNISGSSTGTGSFGRVEVSGDARFQSNLIVDGKVTAQEFHTEIVSSSIIFTSGSTKFGDSSDDNHSFTGSINQSGSFSLNDGNLTVSDNIIIGGTTDLNGNLEVAGNITASLNISASGDILADGRIFEKGTSVIDHATAMSIVFGG